MPASWITRRPPQQPASRGTTRRSLLTSLPAIAVGATAIIGRPPAAEASQGQFQPYYFTNLTGVDLRIGDVVALGSTAGSVILDDSFRSGSRYYVAMGNIARNAIGLFGRGYVPVRSESTVGY